MKFEFGQVIDINDPIPEAQRVKVRVDSIYDDLPVDDIPWAYVARSCDTGITFNIGISTHNLMVGSRVLCLFLDEYYQQPFVICQIPRIIDTTSNTSKGRKTILTKGGQVIAIDDEKSEIAVQDASKNKIVLNTKGIDIESSDTAKLNINIISGKDVNIKSKSQIKVVAPIIDASKSKEVILPESAQSMFTAGPIDTFTGQPNKKSTIGAK